MAKFSVISHDVRQTMALGAQLGRCLRAGDVVALSGIFGAGKTYFTKGIARGLGVRKLAAVNSPSFILCNVHRGRRVRLYHFDAQRLPDARELLNLGLTDGFSDGVSVIEWAEKLPALKQLRKVITVVFTVLGPQTRRLTFSGLSPK